jgi:hypothetical protein
MWRRRLASDTGADVLHRPLGMLATSVAIGIAVAGCGDSRRGDRGHRGEGLIVLDHSIGSIALREERVEVERRLGEGFVLSTDNQRQPPVHMENVLYAKYGLRVWYSSRTSSPTSVARGRVGAVLTLSSRYRTPQGIHVGSRAAELRGILGLKCSLNDCQHGYARRNQAGTTFRLDSPRGEVTAIAISFGH